MNCPRAFSLILVMVLTACMLLVRSADAETTLNDDCGHGTIQQNDADDRSRRLHYDELTGRSTLNFPPHPFVDMVHMRLEMTIPDMNDRRFDARQHLEFAPVGTALSRLALNAGPLDIKSVTIADHQVDFKHDVAAESLVLRIEPPIEPGKRVSAEIQFECVNPPEGLYWSIETEAWEGRAAQLHSQGEPESNRYWFPCHDFPNERLTTELIVRVPEGFIASSNGRLVDESTSDGMSTFHWLQDKPHVTYLVTLVVGKFEIVDVADEMLSMPVYVPPGKSDLVQQTYGRTPQMVRFFSDLLDEPYPWDRYAQLVVRNFAWGGMENTSATTMYDTAIFDSTALLDGDLDGLISHELAHQWFGDLLTCRTWAHIWLNEGFATYLTALWFENRDGVDEYEWQMHRSFKSVIENDRADAPYSIPMISNEYDHPDDVFRKAANPYPKGASVLHMLRQRLGDKVFFQSLVAYVDRHKQTSVETHDLRRVMEDVSGQSLQRFFDQWCNRPGVPKVKINISYDRFDSELVFVIKQLQSINGPNPAFDLRIPVFVTFGSSQDGAQADGQWIVINTDQRETLVAFDLPRAPKLVVVDPDQALLADCEIEYEDGTAEHQLRIAVEGPTLASRVRAIESLADIRLHDDDLVVRTLTNIAQNQSNHHGLRSTAIGIIAELDGASALLTMVGAADKDARIRLSLFEALAALPEVNDGPAEILEQVTAALREALNHDASYAARAAALRGYGEIGAAGARIYAQQAIGTESQHDQIRRAGIDVLAKVDQARDLERVIELAGVGSMSFTRTNAVKAIGALAHHDEPVAIAALSGLLRDHQVRTFRAAGESLVSIGTKEALDVLTAFRAESRSRAARSDLDAWIRSLSAELMQADADPAFDGPEVIWIRIDDASGWTEGFTLMPGDESAFFVGLDMVVDRHDGTLYALAWNTPNRAMHAGEDWAIASAAASSEGVDVELDPRGAHRMRILSRAATGRKLGIVLNNALVRSPVVRSPLSQEVVISGVADEAERAQLAERLSDEAMLSFHMLAKPGERDDESKLRKSLRTDGPEAP